MNNTKETSDKSGEAASGVFFVLFTERSPGFFPKPLCRAEKKPDGAGGESAAAMTGPSSGATGVGWPLPG